MNKENILISAVYLLLFCVACVYAANSTNETANSTNETASATSTQAVIDIAKALEKMVEIMIADAAVNKADAAVNAAWSGYEKHTFNVEIVVTAVAAFALILQCYFNYWVLCSPSSYATQKEKLCLKLDAFLKDHPGNTGVEEVLGILKAVSALYSNTDNTIVNDADKASTRSGEDDHNTHVQPPGERSDKDPGVPEVPEENVASSGNFNL
jgi:hypothetical protein